VRTVVRFDAGGAPINLATFGTPECQSFLDGSVPSCVPWNPFSLGGVTPVALGYLQVPGLQQG
jgi:hypothetical protein